LSSTNKPGVGGWVKVSDYELIEAVDKAGISSDKMKEKYFRWLPRWIPAAAKVYRDNAKANGTPDYAGMTLAEFLKMSAPESK